MTATAAATIEWPHLPTVRNTGVQAALFTGAKPYLSGLLTDHCHADCADETKDAIMPPLIVFDTLCTYSYWNIYFGYFFISLSHYFFKKMFVARGYVSKSAHFKSRCFLEKNRLNSANSSLPMGIEIILCIKQKWRPDLRWRFRENGKKVQARFTQSINQPSNHRGCADFETHPRILCSMMDSDCIHSLDPGLQIPINWFRDVKQARLSGISFSVWIDCVSCVDILIVNYGTYYVYVAEQCTA